jgi:hypothetical protein
MESHLWTSKPPNCRVVGDVGAAHVTLPELHAHATQFPAPHPEETIDTNAGIFHLWTAKTPECRVAGDVGAAHVASHPLRRELVHAVSVHQRSVHHRTAQVPAVACKFECEK